MKKILFISIITLLMALFIGTAILPNDGGSNAVYAMDLTTETTEEAVTTATATEEVIINADVIKQALAELIDEWLGDYLTPLGITGATLVGAILFLLGFLLKKLSANAVLQKAGEQLMNDNRKDVEKLTGAVVDKLAPALDKFALELTQGNALAAVMAQGLDILIMSSNNTEVAKLSKDFHKAYSEALAIKDADPAVANQFKTTIMNMLKAEAAKAIENTVKTTKAVADERLAKLKATYKPTTEEAKSGV